MLEQPEFTRKIIIRELSAHFKYVIIEITLVLFHQVQVWQGGDSIRNKI
jgi:hypothetical protein